MAENKGLRAKIIKIFYSLFTFIFLFTLALEAKDMETILPKPKLKSDISLEEAIYKRRSVRNYSSRELTLEQISQLLWACQGITDSKPLRAAPSAGALYPLEAYLLKNDGLYKYLPQGHKIKTISDENLKEKIMQASWKQAFIKKAPIGIVICAVYERVSSSYGEAGIKYTDIEIGHAAENLRLQAVSLGLSSCPVGAFDKEKVAKILNLPKEEIPVYIIPVGYKE